MRASRIRRALLFGLSACIEECRQVRGFVTLEIIHSGSALLLSGAAGIQSSLAVAERSFG